MKTTAIGIILLSCTLSASALDKATLDKRIGTLAGKFDALQARPDKAIPAETLQNAQGIVLLDRTKAGFILAYQGGGGVAMARDPKSKKWSPPGFVKASEASLGFQVGGEQNFYVILLMTTNAARLLTEAKVDVGAEARGTGGDTTSGVEAKVEEPSVLIYDDRKGLYGGAAVKGGVLTPDNEANRIYHGEALSMHDILFGKKAKATAPATSLTEKIDEQAKKKK